MPTTDNRQLTTDQAAAIRHAVYNDLLMYLPIASYDQARQFVVNLKLCGANIGIDADAGSRERQINAALVRFSGMKVTPDIAETPYRGLKQKEIEYRLNRKFGERLAAVPGFYQRDDAAPFRLNLPFNCALYGYGSHYGPSQLCPFFYSGVLCQPLDRHDFYFLLSSSKYGGPKAQRLTPRDQQYFTQFEEVRV